MQTRSVMFALGYSGLLPFYAAALWLLWPDASGKPLAASVFVVYGTVILAFLGGTVWGYAVTISPPEKYQRLVVSNLAALFAAIAGLAGSALLACLLLAIGQLALLAYERAHGDVRGWYLRFRTRLVMGVLPAHGLFAWGISR
ncbi:MAG: DUF3429 domain-containing protein [Halieaceae bacterium]|nr:DUF3429 domain-containing protein [Halieaceae bacterium]